MSPKQDILDALKRSNWEYLQVIVSNVSEEQLASILGQAEYTDQVSPLHYAVEHDTDNTLFMTLKGKGANMNCYEVNTSEDSRLTALHRAVLSDSGPLLSLLLKLGADPALQGQKGELKGTPEQFARALNRPKLLKIFSLYEAAQHDQTQLPVMFVVIFFVLPIASFVFFSTMKRLELMT